MVHFPWSPTPPRICARKLATGCANIVVARASPPAKTVQNVLVLVLISLSPPFTICPIISTRVIDCYPEGIDASSPLRPLPHGVSAHRQPQTVHFQLAVRPAPRRHHDPAHRRHGRRAEYPG